MSSAETTLADSDGRLESPLSLGYHSRPRKRDADHSEVIAIPNIRSAAKRLRQSEVRRQRNRARKRAIRRVTHQIKAYLAANDKSGAEGLLPALNRAADKAAQRNAIHKNKASRIKSQWARRIAEL